MIRPSEPRLKKNGKPAATFSDVLMWTVVALVALFFVLSVPSAYGFEIAAKAQKALFNWMSIFSNGYVGLKGSK